MDPGSPLDGTEPKPTQPVAAPATETTSAAPGAAGRAVRTPDGVEELWFPVMSTDAQIVVVGGPPGSADRARARVEELERRWTRFHPSELTALNEAAGTLTPVSPDTYRLVEAMTTAWRATEGRFDPTVLRALEASGYDRSIEDVRDREVAPGSGPPAGQAPGCGGIVLVAATSSVLLPAGVALDPGGLGKGLAADLVAQELVEAGADGAQVNLGGDTRMIGRPPAGDAWVVRIDDPWDADEELARIELPDGGGVASSSRLRRRWTVGGEERHHLLDPRTGSAATSGLVAATAVAGNAWWAEACTKVLLVDGADGIGRLRNASAIVVRDDGTASATPDLLDALRRRTP